MKRHEKIYRGMCRGLALIITANLAVDIVKSQPSWNPVFESALILLCAWRGWGKD